MVDIIHVFYSYIADFLKIWIVMIGMLDLKPIRNRRVYVAEVVIQCVLLTLAGIVRKNVPDIVTSLYPLMLIIAICFIFEGKLLKKLAYTLLSYLFILFLDACIIGICSAIYKYPELNSQNYEIVSFFYTILSLVPLSLVVWIKKRRRRTYPIILSKKIYVLLFTGASTGILFITALLVSLNTKISSSGRRLLIIITIILVISYFVACAMMIFVTESRDSYKNLSLISQSIIESQQKYYLLVSEKEQEIHSLRHEMKNHLACIRGLYQADKLSEMEEYMSQLIEASNTSASLFDTGNDIVNAILNDAQSRYKNDHIAIHLEGGFPAKLQIAPMDLCVIFANIISNAVEAIQQIPLIDDTVRYIDVRISTYKNDLYIDVKNPVGRNVEAIDGNLITTKKEKSLHGFGVKNVIQRVQKYQGSFHYNVKDNQFCVEIMMKNW